MKSAKKNTALHHLLYQLQCLHHLQEAMFYNACQAESGGVSRTVCNFIHDSLINLTHRVGGELILLTEPAGIDIPYNIYDHPRTLRKYIRTVERLIANTQE